MISWYAFDKYYLGTDEVSAYGTALLLAPYRRLLYLERNWKVDWQRGALRRVKIDWERNYRQGDEGRNERESGTTSVEMEEPDEFDKYNQEQALLNSFTDEFDHFVKGAPVSLLKGTSALDWWLVEANRAAYSSLSRMAINMLLILLMSAEPERVFSEARRTITWSRFKLGADSVERVECLKFWVRGGLVADWRAELLGDDSGDESSNP